jgi:hypothetical protein
MARDLITLPLRMGAAATGLASHLVERTVVVGVHATERLIELALRLSTPAPASSPAPPTPPVPPEEPMTPDVQTAPEPAPAHVSREASFVESFADPGAEDGPGAAVHIAEPWTGYGRMTANEVIARFAGASAEELAAVALYERAHRGRRTVLAAADRALRRATPPTPRA